MLFPIVLLMAFQSAPSASAKVCVADVANASTVSADLELLAGRLVKNIKRNKLGGVVMDSPTTMHAELRPTRNNLDEAEQKQCDYTLLTQIVDVRAHPGVPESRVPQPGASVPSIDAADPSGGPTGNVYREELKIAFALFRPDHTGPVVDTYVFERASANVSDSFAAAMDRIANRISSEIKKKRRSSGGESHSIP